VAHLTSRDRMLRTINRQEVDHFPCCFMSFTALREKLGDNLYELAKAELGMGLDAMLFIPSTPRALRREHPDLRGLPVHFDPRVKTTEWREEVPGSYPLLHKVYETPAGKLTTSIRLTEDWRFGNRIPFVDDYQIPRALKPLITEPPELEALRYMLRPPSESDIAAFREEVQIAKAFAESHGVLLVGGWGVGMDLADWLCGMEPLMFHMMDRPDFVDDLLEIVHVWNLRRMEVVLSAPVDIFIRRAWYEGCDFVTPGFYHRSILPRLKAEVDLAHQHGARFGYICSSGLQPMLADHLVAGLDVLIGIDPVQGSRTNLPRLKKEVGSTICLWGGVSGALTVERGTEEEVREAVRQAIRSLGPDGFILSPVDNLTVDAPRTWRNVTTLIDEWRRNWPTEEA
jgi:uroporphyrinogen-III decarboxylase